MPSPAIEITRLPSVWTPGDLTQVVPIYRGLRLFALKTSPRAFARTYEEVVLLPNESWAQRVTNPNAVHFIATHANEDPAAAAWKQDPWLGSIVAIRTTTPRDIQADSSTDEEKGTKSDTQQPAVSYQLNAFFVDPKVRGQGVGKRLLQAVIGFARDEMRMNGVELVKISTSANSENQLALEVYARQGFVKTGIERYTAAGEDREAIVMEMVLEIQGLRYKHT